MNWATAIDGRIRMRTGSWRMRAIISNKAIGKAYARRHETELYPMATEQGVGGASWSKQFAKEGPTEPNCFLPARHSLGRSFGATQPPDSDRRLWNFLTRDRVSTLCSTGFWPNCPLWLLPARGVITRANPYVSMRLLLQYLQLPQPITTCCARGWRSRLHCLWTLHHSPVPGLSLDVTVSWRLSLTDGGIHNNTWKFADHPVPDLQPLRGSWMRGGVNVTQPVLASKSPFASSIQRHGYAKLRSAKTCIVIIIRIRSKANKPRGQYMSLYQEVL